MRSSWWIGVLGFVGVVAGACGGGSSHPGPGPCSGSACTCPAGELDCGGGCMDVANDPANCGACGHDCGDAACSAGVCEPQSLAIVPDAPADQLVLDGEDLVFATRGQHTSSGAVYRVARRDGHTTTVYRGLADYPSVAVRADHGIVIADSGQVGGCDTTAGAGELAAVGATPSLVSAGRRCVRSLVATPQGLAWIEDAARELTGGDMPPLLSTLDASAPADSAPAVVRQLAANGFLQVASVGDRLMWIEDASVMQSASGMPASSVTTAGSSIVAFAANANDVAYATLSGDIAVHTGATGTDTTLAENITQVDSLAIDDSFVYVATWSALLAIDRQSGASAELAKGWARGLAQDDSFIYLTRDIVRTGEETEVVRLRKPAAPLLQEAAAPVCSPPLMTCGVDSCFDPRTDLLHCGDCGTACASSERCEARACVCSENSLVCAGACVDQATDASNCGTCGHSCGGGTCVGGDCTPVMLAPNAEAGVHDASALYFAVNSQLRRLDKATLANTLVADVPAPYNYVRYLAQDATHVFMATDMGTIGATNPGAIYVAAKSGSAPTALYSDRSDPSHIATVANGLVWVEDTHTLVYAAADGSGIRGTFTAGTLYSGAADDETRGVVTVGSKVYWLLGDPTASSGAVVQIDLAASHPQPSLMTTLDGYPYSLGVAGTTLDVSAGWPDGRILAMPLGGGPIAVLARGLDKPTALTVAPDGDLLWMAGDSRPVVYDLAPGAVVPRIVESGSLGGYVTTLCVDADRLFTVGDGVLAVQR